MSMQDISARGSGSREVRFVDALDRTVSADGDDYVVREIGAPDAVGTPLVALTHLGATLDSWDPELVDLLARGRRMILIGYRGVGGSTGAPRDSIEAMARDAIAVTAALGLSRIDLFGQSLGGMVAQAIIEQAPDLVDRLILSGAGPRGGVGLTAMTGVMVRGIARGVATLTNPTTLLFFTRTPNGKSAAAAYQRRLRLRATGRDGSVALGVFSAQLRAVTRWGQGRATGRTIHGPVLIVHGDHDRLVPPANAAALAAIFPDAEVHVLPDSAHGVVFQNRRVVADIGSRFLRR